MSALSLAGERFRAYLYSNTRDGELTHAPWAIAQTADEIFDVERLEKALIRLADAGFNRDTTEGDPIRLIEVRAELREAVKHAREIIRRRAEGE